MGLIQTVKQFLGLGLPPLPPFRMGGSADGTIDEYRKQRAPTQADLIRNYERTAYACANLNANILASARLRAYKWSAKGEARSKSLYATVPITKSVKDRLLGKSSLRLSSYYDVEEVVDHPVLDLIYNPHSAMDGTDFLTINQLYQEICGISYVRVDKALGIPIALTIYPAQCMQVTKTDERNLPLEYEYTSSSGGKDTIPAKEIIIFKCPNIHNPYAAEGYSPLRAAFETVNISNKLLAYEASLLDNEARPGLIASPTGDGVAGDEEAYRQEVRLRRFSRGGVGDTMVNQRKWEYFIPSFPPRDLARLEISGAADADIARAFGVPLALLEDNQFNRATLQAALVQHGRQAIAPRIKRLESKLNKYIVPLFDDSGKLFLAFDDPTPESRQELATELTQYVTTGIITANEARVELDRKPRDDGDELRGVPGTFSVGDTPDAEDNTDTADTSKDKPKETTAENAPQATEPKPPKPQSGTDTSKPESTPTDTPDAAPEVFNGAQISNALQILAMVADGRIPRDSGIGSLEELLGMSRDRAEHMMGSIGNGFTPQNNNPVTPLNNNDTQTNEDG